MLPEKRLPLIKAGLGTEPLIRFTIATLTHPTERRPEKEPATLLQGWKKTNTEAKTNAKTKVRGTIATLAQTTYPTHLSIYLLCCIYIFVFFHLQPVFGFVSFFVNCIYL